MLAKWELGIGKVQVEKEEFYYRWVMSVFKKMRKTVYGITFYTH